MADDPIVRVRFTANVIFRFESHYIGEELDVTPAEATNLAAYRSAVRVDGKAAPMAKAMTVGDVQHGDPVAEHRDPDVRPSRRRR